MAITIVGEGGSGGSSSGGGSSSSSSTPTPICLGSMYTWWKTSPPQTMLYDIVLVDFSPDQTVDRVEPTFTAYSLGSLAAFSGFVYGATNTTDGNNQFSIQILKNGSSFYQSSVLSYTQGNRSPFSVTVPVSTQSFATGDVLQFQLYMSQASSAGQVYSVLFPFVYMGV